MTKVHPPSHRTGGYESYDVRYVLGGGENKLSPDVLTLAPADDEVVLGRKKLRSIRLIRRSRSLPLVH